LPAGKIDFLYRPYAIYKETVKMKNRITIEIEKIVYGGLGMGRVEGKVVFIPFTAPGDRVTAVILKEKKNYLEGRIQTIERASAKRVEPFCRFFGRCGGCQLQHLNYADQISVKAEILQGSLHRLSSQHPFEILPMILSTQDRAYRLRAQFKGGQSGRKTILGFLELKSHQIVEIDQCPLLFPLANKILQELKGELRGMEGNIPLREVELFISPDEDKGVLHLTGDGPKVFELSKKYFRKSALLKGLKLNGSRRVSWGDLRLRFLLPGLASEKPIPVQIQTGSFFQVNPRQNESLIRRIGDWALLSGIEGVMDLFCGAGNLTLPLAQKAGKIWGIDSDEKAIATAKENAEENGLQNVIFRAERAGAGAFELLKEMGRIDLAILDPPRAGAKEVLESLAGLGPKKILYVSCEPPTLIRDLARLGELGYDVTRVQPLDMFPQTYHLEVIAELVKTGFKEDQLNFPRPSN
jgi:23S rRNA (uracil1939-C5)-methyltransferase